MDNISKEQTNVEDRDIVRICFTGGPCAGKTSALSYVAERLRETDYAVFCVPEAASLLFQSGCNLDLSNYSVE